MSSQKLNAVPASEASGKRKRGKGSGKPFRGMILPTMIVADRVPLEERMPEPKARGPGGPALYSPKLAADVLRLLANGCTLQEIEATEGCPTWPTIRKWLLEYPEFATQYTRTREISTDWWESEALNRAKSAKSTEEVAAARLFLDAVKWANAKRNPKVYGDRIEHSGAIGVGLADRLEAARKRLAAAGGAVTEGVALPSPQSTTLPAVATDEPELVE